MKAITHSIDWLQYSIAWPNEIAEWPTSHDQELALLRTCIPTQSISGLPPQRPSDERVFGMHGYSRSFDMLYASVHVNPNSRQQKIGVRMTGRDLDAYRELGGTSEALMEFVHYNHASCSRIDIAFDLYGYEIDPKRIYDDWKRGKLQTSARTLSPLTSAVRDGEGNISEASTLYIGSRSSDVMVRMYEKGKEQGTDEDWLRVEIEVKGDKAKSIIGDIVRFGVGPVGRSLLNDAFPSCKYRFMQDLIAKDTTALSAVGKQSTDRLVWLHTIILPLIADELADEWNSGIATGLTQELEGLIRANWTTRVERLRRQYQHEA